MQSTSDLHVAMIMDGNGRWAEERSLRRRDGHQAGGDAVRRIVEAAPDLGVTDLTLFAFSSDNWQRPPSEVAALMRLFAAYLERETPRCLEQGVRIEVFGRRDRLPRRIAAAARNAESRTEDCERLRLRIGIDYSSRAAIATAARQAPNNSVEAFRAALAAAMNLSDPLPDVDLLIRTGREMRLSDFLLWECSYAELYFTVKMWPDMTGDDLADAVSDYQRRQRRFGRLITLGEAVEELRNGTL
ncbi:MAG TPA: polyprenyl diphosphate synthase [Thermoanaerobaculia bacterium]|nr:polyprenyl diphosphate synthase [Thermoanaerobaculia bacterium]